MMQGMMPTRFHNRIYLTLQVDSPTFLWIHGVNREYIDEIMELFIKIWKNLPSMGIYM